MRIPYPPKTDNDELDAWLEWLVEGLQKPNFEALTIGDGTNYANFDTDGELTLHGTARVYRHIRVTAPSWKKGGTAPTEGRIGIYPTWKFGNATLDEVHYSLIVPYRIAASSTINVSVDWATGADEAGTVCWKLDYINVAEGETIAGSTTTISKTTAGSHTTGKLIRTALTTGITGAVEHDDLGLKLWRDTGVDNLNTTADLIQVHFRFLLNKLGLAT